MYYGYGYGMYWDPTYFLVIIGLIITMIASAKV
ncbi:MAG: peptidase, partial [Eubacterium sp.]|nr:peptidase [Eubacterium sp.]